VLGASAGPVVSDSQGKFSFTVDRANVGLIDVSETDLWGQGSNTAEVDVAHAAPVLTLSTQVLPGHEVQLSGAVTGAHPAGVVVTFSGAAAGSTTTDANGNYAFTSAGAALGTVYAHGVDDLLQSSNTASAAIVDTAPVVTMSITDMTATTVTLSGKVTDVDAAGQTFAVSGTSVSSVVSDARGNFSFTVARASVGLVDVTETDLWGQTSNTAEVDVADAPFITSFVAMNQISRLYVFEGEVLGANVQGLTVTFGGDIAALNGQTTTIGADGTFSYSIVLPADVFGIVSAQTSNDGISSNVRFVVLGSLTSG